MKPTLWQRLTVLTRRLTPFLLTLLLVLIVAVPLRIPGVARVMPMLPLIALFHWALYRPDLMPAVAVFAVGVMQDILGGVPLGTSSLIYLFVYWTVGVQRRFLVGKPFAIIWLGFAVVAAGACLGGWILISLYHVVLAEPFAFLFQYLTTLGFFPVLSLVFLRWQGMILKRV